MKICLFVIYGCELYKCGVFGSGFLIMCLWRMRFRKYKMLTRDDIFIEMWFYTWKLHRMNWEFENSPKTNTNCEHLFTITIFYFSYLLEA